MGKFTLDMRKTRRADWRFYYFDYSAMKSFIRERTETGGKAFSETDESEFIKLCDAEISKSADFFNMKLGELTRHVQFLERQKVPNLDFNNNVERDKVHNEVDELTADLVDLSSFQDFCRVACMKIIKKHDKTTSFFLSAMYRLKLGPDPVTTGTHQLDSLVARLSSIYQALRSGGTEQQLQSQQGTEQVSAQSFVRKTTKFWVRQSNVAALKGVLLKHLPVFVFGARSSSNQHDSLISSVYLDNEHHEIYMGRLEKLQGAQAIRFRWYGSGPSIKEVFVERKMHSEDWTGDESVKERFPLKEKQIADFISGKLDLSVISERLRKHGSSQDQIDNALKLANEISQFISDKKLVPFVRTSYNRMAFQQPNSAKVRISLDSELCMTSERGCPIGSWKRSDNEINDRDFVHFPHAVLEIKLQHSVGEVPPLWISTLIEGNLLDPVPKFSKFVHGSSVLFEVPKVPYWLPQLQSFEEPSSSTATVGPTAPQSSQQQQPAPSRRKSIIPNEERQMGERQPLLGNRSQNQQQRIAVPVRVEPKVYFANERTFLSWIHFSIFLGSAASALLALGNNKKAKLSGISIVSASVLVAVYALLRFEYRAVQIDRRMSGRYDDRIGPIFLVVLFIIVMALSVFFATI